MTKANFKMAKLSDLENIEHEIIEEKKCMHFFITGRTNNDDYSFEFYTTISKEDMLKLPYNKHIDFKQYASEGDIILGINGIFDLNVSTTMDIIRYLPNSFMLNILLFDNQNNIGTIELDFKL